MVSDEVLIKLRNYKFTGEVKVFIKIIRRLRPSFFRAALTETPHTISNPPN